MDECVKLLGTFFWGLVVTAAVTLPCPLYQYTGKNFCNFAQYLSILGGVHGFAGGSGIALMRMLFIQFPNNVGLQPMVTALLISTSTFGMSAGISFVMVNSANRAQDLTSLCTEESEDLRNTLFHYSSDKSIIYEGHLARLGILVFTISVVLLELSIYSSIYKFLANHNKSMKGVVPESVIKNRTKSNVVDLAGHALTFAIELLWLLVKFCRILSKTSNLGSTKTEKVLLRCFVMSLDGVLSFVHLCISNPLRADCIALCGMIFRSFACIGKCQMEQNLATYWARIFSRKKCSKTK